MNLTTFRVVWNNLPLFFYEDREFPIETFYKILLGNWKATNTITIIPNKAFLCAGGGIATWGKLYLAGKRFHPLLKTVEILRKWTYLVESGRIWDMACR